MRLAKLAHGRQPRTGRETTVAQSLCQLVGKGLITKGSGGHGGRIGLEVRNDTRMSGG